MASDHSNQESKPDTITKYNRIARLVTCAPMEKCLDPNDLRKLKKRTRA